MTTPPNAPILRLEGVGKRFPGVVALRNVSLSLWQGEVHALLGENGAGKSTLIKILTGVQQPDEGRIVLSGQDVRIGSPRDAARLGITLVPQETLAVPELSIGRNILLGLEQGRTRRDRLTLDERNRVSGALARIGADFDPEVPAKDLGVPQIRLAQIARALLQPGKVMVLDEPTAVLSEPDADHLLDRLDALRRDGLAILYVTHRLSEMMRLADRSTILRDGERVGSFDRGEIDRDETVRLIARNVAEQPRPAHAGTDAAREITAHASPLLDVRGIGFGRHFTDISFSAPPGTIVGIAGVQGSGHGELLRAIGGVASIDRGEVWVDGRTIRPNDPVASVDAGVLTVPADRRGSAIVAEQSVRANIALGRRVRESARRWGLRHHTIERQIAEDYIRKLEIRPPLTEMKIGLLSGGNQQKVAIARILEGAPRVVAVEEPTQGIDVRAKAEIHALLHQVARQTGAVVVIATSEFEELLGLADDIHVMRAGRLGHHITGPRATYHEILENALP